MTCCKGSSSQNEPGFSWQIGSIYLLNVMLGVGVLTIPKPFCEAGWLLGLIVLILLGLTSYCSGTFVIEALSIYNACHGNEDAQDGKEKESGNQNKDNIELCDKVIENKYIHENKEETDNDLQNPSNLEASYESNENIFLIRANAEMSDLCKMFFHKAGFFIYCAVVSIYLYGALSIEFACVSKSLASVICGDPKSFADQQSPCKAFKSYSVMTMYRYALSAFVIFWCPFVFFNISTTKILQIITFLFRLTAITSMTVLALVKISKKEDDVVPNIAKFDKLADFVAIALYVFVCHTAIPPTLTPITNKNRINLSTMLPFLCMLILAVCLVMTSVFGFHANEVQDLYTLNFARPLPIRYLLELYPVLTLSSNSPVTGIILRENLKTLFLTRSDEEYSVFVRRFLFPIIVIIPPVLIAFSTCNVGLLVGFTGSYAGGIILYVIPTLLVFYARRRASSTFGDYENKYRSPFQHRFWIVIILAWYIVSLILVTYYKISVRTN